LTGPNTETSVASPEIKPGLIVSSMVVLFVSGLLAITLLMGMMKGVLNLNIGVILGFTLFSFLIMLAIEVVLVRLLFRGRRGVIERPEKVAFPGPSTNQLDPAHARALPQHTPSVTENTTRLFDPVYNERSKE
jgi:hypothetical protein